jgi:hypothetical protein
MVLSRPSLGETEEKHEKDQAGQPVTWPGSKLVTVTPTYSAGKQVVTKCEQLNDI